MLTTASRQTDFPALTGRTYLNTAAEDIPPLSIPQDALMEGVEVIGETTKEYLSHGIAESVIRGYRE